MHEKHSKVGLQRSTRSFFKTIFAWTPTEHHGAPAGLAPTEHRRGTPAGTLGVGGQRRSRTPVRPSRERRRTLLIMRELR